MGKCAECSKEINVYRDELLYPMIQKEIARLAAETDRLWDAYIKTKSVDKPEGNDRAYMKYDRTWQREMQTREIFTAIVNINGVHRTSIGDFAL